MNNPTSAQDFLLENPMFAALKTQNYQANK